MTVTGPCDDRHMDEHQFGFSVLVDELRCRPTEWLAERRAWLAREQRRLHVEELAVTRVLDERGAINDALAARDGVSVRTARETLATARALEDLSRDRGGGRARRAECGTTQPGGQGR